MVDEGGAPAVRASDSEREVATERLRGAAGAGRLTFEELADRIEVAADAVTREDLERLTADLPADPAATPSRAPASTPTRASSVFGDVRQSGGWTVPAEGTWKSVFGDVVLDLREARVTTPDVLIDARTFFGDVELLVPEGVEVEVRSKTFFGAVKQEAVDAAAPGAPRIVLTGGTVFGDVRVRPRRLRESLAERLGGRRHRRPDSI